MNAAKVNPKMLTLAREARGLSQIELADKLKISQSNQSRMELEFIGVNDNTFKEIQRTLKFPEEFFLQQTEILPPAFYRKRDKVAAKLISEIEANVNIYRLGINKLLGAMKQKAPAIPDLNPLKTGSPKDSAKQLRKLWKVSAGAIDDLSKLLEDHGILVVAFDFGTERVDGRSILTEEKHPVIFVNKTQPPDRQRFTLAYELGHLVMHCITPPPFGDETGHEANVFAAEFLMPEKDIKHDFSDGLTMQKLGELKKKWKVSMQALLYQAADMKLLTDNQKRYLIGQFNALKIRRREPPSLDIPKETPTLLRNFVSRYRAKQKMTVTEMADFFNLSQEDFIQRYS